MFFSGRSRRSHEQQLADFQSGVRHLAEANVGIDGSILRFCGLQSSDSLRRHFEQRRALSGAHAAGWTKSLVDKLAGFCPSPRLAGLGALAIAIFIDILSLSRPDESMKEALRSVFAEEKASEVWDLIDECIKRCWMNIEHLDELRSDLRQMERQLSFALTKLKNSMVRDGQMSSRALKVWVNGAAFHIQTLIHLVRIGGLPSCDPVEKLLSEYQRDVDALFAQHQVMLREKCQVTTDAMMTFGYGGMRPPPTKYFVTEHNGKLVMEDVRFVEAIELYCDWFQAQKRLVQQHLSEVGENLERLVTQSGDLPLN